jgi:hypothetical protein
MAARPIRCAINLLATGLSEIHFQGAVVSPDRYPSASDFDELWTFGKLATEIQRIGEQQGFVTRAFSG